MRGVNFPCLALKMAGAAGHAHEGFLNL
jgi:hypothetical protein